MTAEEYRQTATESETQLAIVQALMWAGAEVEQVSERRQRCSECGEFSHAPSGVDRTIGDLLVRDPSWPVALKLNLEVKTTAGRLTADQKRAHERRGIVVVRSTDHAIEAYRYAQSVMGRTK